MSTPTPVLAAHLGDHILDKNSNLELGEKLLKYWMMTRQNQTNIQEWKSFGYFEYLVQFHCVVGILSKCTWI